MSDTDYTFAEFQYRVSVAPQPVELNAEEIQEALLSAFKKKYPDFYVQKFTLHRPAEKSEPLWADTRLVIEKCTVDGYFHFHARGLFNKQIR